MMNKTGNPDAPRQSRAGYYVLPARQATYNYRYFLPYAPEWGTPEFCDRRLQELLVFCRRARIAAVQFYVNTLPGTYYMPAHSAAEQAHWAQWMRETVAPALRAAGLSYQLNFQMLLGASSGGLDMRDEYAWEYLVDQHGRETLGCACPVGPMFRKTMGAMLRLWAATGPDVIWIDDDFRLHNHGMNDRDPDYYCYCRYHLRAFAKIIGRPLSRAELVRAVLAPGRPGVLRQQWLNFLGDTMTETAAWICRQVQTVSPHTRLAQMTSLPDVHAAEGRDWKAFLTALCGGAPPMTRPCSGIYMGTNAPVKAAAISYLTIAQSIAVVEQTAGPHRVEYGPELENTRFTTWSKSAAHTRFLLILGQLTGCSQITLSLHDLDGSPLDEEPTLAPLLRRSKPVLDTLAGLRLSAWSPEGIIFLSDPDSARKVRLDPGAKLNDLATGRDGESILLQSGIPARYAPVETAVRAKGVVALDRLTAWCPSDRDMKRLLAGRLLLDGGALGVLWARGFGKYLGVDVGAPQNYTIMAETYSGDVLPGVHACRVPHRGRRWRELTLRGAPLASEFIDAKNRRHVGSAIYRNALGGRVAMAASWGDFDWGTFGSHARLRWLHGLLRWLTHDRFVVLPHLPHHGLTVVYARGRTTLAAVANLGTDPLTRLELYWPGRSMPASVHVLHANGAWRRTLCGRVAKAPGPGRVTLPCRLNVYDWLIARFDR